LCSRTEEEETATLQGRQDHLKAGLLSDEESNGSDTSASGSEISQTDELQQDLEMVVPGSEEVNGDGVAPQEQPSLHTGDHPQDGNETMSPVDTFHLQGTWTGSEIGTGERDEAVGEGEGYTHHSLLSSLKEELQHQPSLSLPETTVYRPSPEALQQQLDDEFEVVTLQRMKSLRQRIFESIKPTAPVVNPIAPVVVSTQLPLERVSEILNDENEGETPLSEKENGVGAMGEAAVSSKDVEGATPIVSTVVEAEEDDEPRERSCTVDSDDELE
jgi:hypothetical protein